MKTIVALSSAPLNCAIHTIRVSGDECYKIVQKITKEKIIKEPYKIQHVSIIDDKKQMIDDVLLLKFVAPHSYNAENMIEINCHGGLFVTNKIIELLIKNGATYAKHGEFTYRAVINGKINMLQANAINNIIKSKNFSSLKIAHNGLNKKSSAKIEKMRDEIFKIIGNIEVNIDYPEYEDYKNLTNNVLLKKIKPIKSMLINLIKFSQLSAKIMDGFNIAIIGAPNAGKSSLLNKILDEDKAIVSNIPGTTRDIVEGQINYKNITFNFIDTAGIREKAKYFEKIGINKSIEQINKSDLVLFIVDKTKKTTKKEKEIFELVKKKPYIIVVNKSDLKTKKTIFNGFNFSCKFDNINLVLNKIINKINIQSLEKTDLAFMQTPNEIGILKKNLEIIGILINDAKKKKPIDLLVESLYEIYNNFNLLLGENCDLDFLEKLFANFCVGK